MVAFESFFFHLELHGADGLGEYGSNVDADSISVDFWLDMKTLRIWYPNKITFGRGALGSTEFRTRRLKLFNDSVDEIRRVDIEDRFLAVFGIYQNRVHLNFEYSTSLLTCFDQVINHCPEIEKWNERRCSPQDELYSTFVI